MKRLLLIGVLISALLALTTVALAAPAAAPQAQEQRPVIAQPERDAAVRGVVQIVGSATHPQFQRYELYYAPLPVPSDQAWIFIGDAHFQPQPLGLLGTWSTGSLPDGPYTLRVRVVKVDGNYIDSEPRRVVVANRRAPETPTSVATLFAPTAVPTPLPPTPTILVALPTIQTRAAPTATPQPIVTPILPAAGTPGAGTATTGSLVSGERLLMTARKSATYTGAFFLALAAFFALKWLLAWLWHKVRP